MKTIYLIRHGQKTSNYGDPPLTALGRRQATITGEHLKEKSVRHIIASPSRRTQQTAGIIAETLGLSVVTDDRLRERMDWDDESETWEEFIAEWIKTDIDRDYVCNRGYSARDCGNRFEAVLRERAVSSDNTALLIVSHGGVIGDFLRNTFSEDMLPLTKDPNSDAYYIDISECSITTVELSGDDFAVSTIGDSDHLLIPVK